MRKKTKKSHGSDHFEFRIAESLQKYIEVMWGSRYFVTACSSLSMLIATTSRYLKEFYAVDGCCNGASAAKAHKFSLRGYLLEGWFNTEEQRKQMLTYSIDSVKEH